MEESEVVTLNKLIMFKTLFKRYKDMVDNSTDIPTKKKDELLHLIDEALNRTAHYPFHKLNRWLGWVQGVLTALDITTVDIEREFTRPIIHKAYGKSDSFG